MLTVLAGGNDDVTSLNSILIQSHSGDDSLSVRYSNITSLNRILIHSHSDITSVSSILIQNQSGDDSVSVWYNDIPSLCSILVQNQAGDDSISVRYNDVRSLNIILIQSHSLSPPPLSHTHAHTIPSPFQTNWPSIEVVYDWLPPSSLPPVFNKWINKTLKNENKDGTIARRMCVCIFLKQVVLKKKWKWRSQICTTFKTRLPFSEMFSQASAGA